jgi:AcrR family transcriptional regulator
MNDKQDLPYPNPFVDELETEPVLKLDEDGIPILEEVVEAGAKRDLSELEELDWDEPAPAIPDEEVLREQMRENLRTWVDQELKRITADLVPAVIETISKDLHDTLEQKLMAGLRERIPAMLEQALEQRTGKR